MTKRSRRNHSGSFKAKVPLVALAALRRDKTLIEIAQQHEVHPNQVTEWKRQLLERAAEVFDGGVAGRKEDGPDLKEALNRFPLARRWLCGMGCANGDDANGRSPSSGA